MLLQMLEGEARLQKALTPTFKATVNLFPLALLGQHIPHSHLPCLMDMSDVGPWINPQTLTYTFALLRCPHWQHHSLHISWVYGSYLCSQGISEEAEMRKK